MYAAVADASAWKASDLPHRKETLVIQLTAPQVAALDASLESWKALGKPLKDLQRGDFDLGAMRDEVTRWFDILKNGRGVFILRGFPVDRWTVEETAAVYLGLGAYFGKPATQSVMGDLVGHVIDMTREMPDARSYQSNKELVFHSDFCDIVGLLCLRKSQAGGLSRICSGTAIHDEMLETSPELLPALYQGFRVYRMGEQTAGSAPVTSRRVPVFSRQGGKLSVLFVKVLYEQAAAFSDAPLSEQEAAALARVAELAEHPDWMLEFMLEPGEAIFANNLVVLHSRTAIQNSPDAPRRHLLRLWLNDPAFRPRVAELDVYETAGGIGADEARRPRYAGEALDRAIKGN